MAKYLDIFDKVCGDTWQGISTSVCDWYIDGLYGVEWVVADEQHSGACLGAFQIFGADDDFEFGFLAGLDGSVWEGYAYALVEDLYLFYL